MTCTKILVAPTEIDTTNVEDAQRQNKKRADHAITVNLCITWLTQHPGWLQEEAFLEPESAWPAMQHKSLRNDKTNESENMMNTIPCEVSVWDLGNTRSSSSLAALSDSCAARLKALSFRASLNPDLFSSRPCCTTEWMTSKLTVSPSTNRRETMKTIFRTVLSYLESMSDVASQTQKVA